MQIQPPGSPPFSYAVENGRAVFFRRVGDLEYQSWVKTRQLETIPGGTEFGKYLTTTKLQAQKWGQRFVEEAWDKTVGKVLKVCIPLDEAKSVDLVGQFMDGIGTVYFAKSEFLVNAVITLES